MSSLSTCLCARYKQDGVESVIYAIMKSVARHRIANKNTAQGWIRTGPATLGRDVDCSENIVVSLLSRMIAMKALRALNTNLLAWNEEQFLRN